MKTSSQYKVEGNLAIILVGEPKSGKTRVMTSFPAPYILDLDKNLSSALRVAGDKVIYYDQVDIDDAGKPIEVVKQWDRATACIEAAIKDPNVKTICIDSLTRLGELVEAHIIARLKAMGVKLRPDTVDEQIRLADYDTYATFLLRAVALCRASGKYVVWTSHQALKEDPQTGMSKMRFSIAGKLKDTLGGYFTDVWGMKAETKMVMVGTKAVEKTTYTIRTRPGNAMNFVPLGTSIPTLDPELDITDKTQDEIWKLLEPKLSLNAPATK